MGFRFVSLLLLVVAVTKVTALQCWECSNVKTQDECLKSGRMVKCRENQPTCQTTLRHGGWGPEPMIEKSCKQRSACGANFMQNSQITSVIVKDTQCTMKPPASVCRCCCSIDGCNRDSLFCEEDEEMMIGGHKCNKLTRPRFGTMRCTRGMMPQSECKFSCKKGYQLVGSPVSKCDMFGKRDFEAPKCRMLRCKWLRKVRNGSKTCTRSNALQSSCTFSCNEGYTLTGAKVIKCLEYSGKSDKKNCVWSRPAPKCRNIDGLCLLKTCNYFCCDKIEV